jgi:hypothetical protein
LVDDRPSTVKDGWLGVTAGVGVTTIRGDVDDLAADIALEVAQAGRSVAVAGDIPRDFENKLAERLHPDGPGAFRDLIRHRYTQATEGGRRLDALPIDLFARNTRHYDVVMFFTSSEHLLGSDHFHQYAEGLGSHIVALGPPVRSRNV